MKNTKQDLNKMTHQCSLEPQMGKCVWGWCEKYKGYLCSICGKEVITIKEVKE